MVIRGAGRVVRGAEVDDVGVDAVVGEREEAVFFCAGGEDYLSAVHYVSVDIDRVDGVGDEDGVIL